MPQALASLDDVNRVLGYTTGDDTARDAKLRSDLMAVEAWALTRLKDLPDVGPQVAVYWDVPEDATLHLPTDDGTVTKVNVFHYPSATGVVLSPLDLGLGFGYELSDDGKLFLRPVLMVTPFEGAIAERRIKVYARVEVHYISTGIIPKNVTEGVAILAAGYFKEGPRILNGFTSERIGDYSYTRADTSKPNDEAEYIQRALWFLGPSLKRNKVTVV